MFFLGVKFLENFCRRWRMKFSRSFRTLICFLVSGCFLFSAAFTVKAEAKGEKKEAVMEKKTQENSNSTKKEDKKKEIGCQ